jgi:hypothetical protein
MALTFCLALTATACGDDDGGVPTGGPTTAASGTTAASATTASPETTAATTPTTTTPATTDDGLGPFAEFFSIAHPFNVEYPESWEVEQDSFGAVVTFLSPLTSDDDPFHENVNLVIEDLGGADVTLEEYVDAAIAQLRNVIPDIQINDSFEDIMGEERSWLLTYTGTQEGFGFTWVQEVALFEGNAYILTYTGLNEGDDYVEFRPQAIAIFHSFDFRD